MSGSAVVDEPPVGVLGGVGPLATAHFLARVVALTAADRDQDHVNLAVLQHASIPDRTAYILGRSDTDPGPVLAEDLSRLERLDVSFVVIPCNTACYFVPGLRAQARVPVLSTVDEAIAAVVRAHPGVRRIGVLGTEGTVEAGLYTVSAARVGCEVVLPDEDDARVLQAIIYDQVKAGRPVDVTALVGLVEAMHARGAEVVVLGCTELSVAAAQGLGTAVPVIDALDALAAVVITRTGRKLRSPQ
ncbi:aspartate/glutamate racemase family protein [Cellulomonas sp. P22]|uniref:aspartate/glutamate racemase family protein n=1 Tax=Cellulomonas sp. P22 TaxID=3373189 RepID=UPI0037A4BB0B